MGYLGQNESQPKEVAMKRVENPLDERLQEALFRYQVISQALVHERTGQLRPGLIEQIAAAAHVTADARVTTVSKRSVYRWLKAFKTDGFKGLLPALRASTSACISICPQLIEYFKTQKRHDPVASIPELIKRAEVLGLIAPGRKVNRVTLWRCLKRLGIATRRIKAPKGRDCRRFAFPHRMQMVICDGKHFRAGPGRLRRVALFFLDDATRMGLGVVVGTSESAGLFLRGLYKVILAFGFMTALYVDNGSGFIANDAIEVLAKLKVLFIHGTPGYPQARGKIERFNRTAKDQVLRTLDGNPEVDPSCGALELRLHHYLFKQYNPQIHESLDNSCPMSVFQNDPRALTYPESQEHLLRAFVLKTQKRVSSDNVISICGKAYEAVRGHAGEYVTVHRNLLDESLSMLHQGRLVKLALLDPAANAYRQRSKPYKDDTEVSHGPVKSAAQLRFEQDYSPIIDADGGFDAPK